MGIPPTTARERNLGERASGDFVLTDVEPRYK
jgi:hypothetical protein